LVGKPVSFPLFRHSGRSADRAGDLVRRDSDDFAALPSVETVLAAPKKGAIPKDPRIPVRVRTTLRATGLLRMELESAEPRLGWSQRWPLEFALRIAPGGTVASGREPGAGSGNGTSSDGASPTQSLAEEAGAMMMRRLKQGHRGRDRLTSNTVLAVAEKRISAPRAAWNAGLVRALFDVWMNGADARLSSPDHEEVWLHIAGYLL